MSLLVVGTVAFDAIETPFGKTDKIIGGAATYASLSASYFTKNINLVGAVGDKSEPEEIYSLFGISKKAFKRIVGVLYKEQRVVISDHELRLVDMRGE